MGRWMDPEAHALQPPPPPRVAAVILRRVRILATMVYVGYGEGSGGRRTRAYSCVVW